MVIIENVGHCVRIYYWALVLVLRMANTIYGTFFCQAALVKQRTPGPPGIRHMEGIMINSVWSCGNQIKKVNSGLLKYLLLKPSTHCQRLNIISMLHIGVWRVSRVARRIVCDWMPLYYADSTSERGACWAFDRQLMVHEALGEDISVNPQVSLPIFLSPPLWAPIKLWHRAVFPSAL